MSGYDYKKYAVLYVDDEVQSLKYFPRLFGDDLRCLTANSVAQAREMIAQEGDRIGVVISDQRMPGETGVELLAWLRQNRPQIVRILTTAYSDLDSAIEAVNSGAIFRYVVKPWEDRDLRGVLLRAMEFHLVQRERNALLREKLTVLQRMVVMDRVRSFAVLAAGLANRIKNPMLALKTFLDHAPARAPTDIDDSKVQWGDLWIMAQHESQRILDLVQDLVRKTVEPEYHFAPDTAIASVLESGLAEARKVLGDKVVLTLGPEVPTVVADRVLTARMFHILVQRMLALEPRAGALSVTVTAGINVWGKPGLRVLFRTDHAPWGQQQMSDLFSVLAPGPGMPNNPDMDLLAAYFIAYHHTGNLLVHRNPPHGPGFEVLLPLDPTAAAELPLERNWVESLFTFPGE